MPLMGWARVRVSGPSMVPTLYPDDVAIINYRARIRPGDVVLGRFRTMPDRPVVKRAARRTDDGWWLVSDNEYAGGDSTSHGAADVQARVVIRIGTRYRPRLVRRLVP